MKVENYTPKVPASNFDWYRVNGKIITAEDGILANIDDLSKEEAKALHEFIEKQKSVKIKSTVK